MPIALPCNQCGLDLTRVRAVRTPGIALPVVSCPTCGWSVARRRGAAAIPWMAHWRFAIAAIRLVLVLGFFNFGLYVIAGSSVMLLDFAQSRVYQPQAALLLGVVLGVGSAVGCVVLIGHLRPIFAWAAWTLALLAFVLVIFVTMKLFELSIHVNNALSFSDFPLDRGQWARLGGMFVVMSITSLLCTLGLGFLVGLIERRARNTMWPRLRLRLRERPRP